MARAKDRPYVILITDRRSMGAPIRAVPQTHLGQQTTLTLSRAQRFRTLGEARTYLRTKVERTPRYLYTISEV